MRPIMMPVYQYRATAINVVDGDTIDVNIDLGFRLTMVMRVRLYGIDTPERGQSGAAEATEALRRLVIGTPLVVATVKPHDKYGRWLASVATATCPDVALALIAGGYGVAYSGERKR